MAKYRLGDVAPIQQGTPPMEYPCWLLNLDMVESNTGRILEYVYVQPDEIGSSIVSFDIYNVLYSKLRPYLNKVVLPDRAGFATSEMLPLRPDTTIITREYLTYFLRSPHFVGYINDKTSGAKMPRANTSDLKAVEIDCPSLERQNAISGVFEHLTSIIDLYQRQLLALDTLIKARFVEMFEQGFYEEVAFGDICEFLRNGANIKQTKGASGIPITRIETLANDVFNTDRLGYAGIFEMGKYEGYRLQAGDILISHINSIAYLGRAVQYKGQLGNTPVIHGMNLLCARIKRSFCPTFVEFFFKTPVAKEYISSITKKAVNQASITTTDLKKMRIPAPPIGEQEQFASFVSQVDKSKAVVQAALDKAQVLFDSLMQKYFG